MGNEGSPTVSCVASRQVLGWPVLSLCHLSQDERVSRGSQSGSFRKPKHKMRQALVLFCILEVRVLTAVITDMACFALLI